MMNDRKAVGFTLVEVMAAIALTGLAISGGVLLFRQLDDEATRIRRESASVTEQGNGERLLRALTRDAEASIDIAERFRGDEWSATYRSWCATASGWLERCAVLLAVDRRQDSSAIVAHLSTGEQLVLGRHRGAVEFRYLDRLGHDSAWVRYWGESLTLPAAIAIVRERDTLVLPLGAARE